MGDATPGRGYAALAAGYDRRWRRYLEISHARTLAALAPRGGERILDAGCGTGLLLGRIARAVPGAQLAGIDATPEMLAVAAARVPAGVLLVRGDVQHLPFAAASFDAVVSANILHALRDPRAALDEAARVLRAGGRFVLTDWCGEAAAMRLLGWWLRRRGRGPAAPLGRRELARLAAGAGLQAGAGERFRAGGGWRLHTWTARRSG